MAGKVFFSACHCAGPAHRARFARYEMGQQWMELQQWIFRRQVLPREPEAGRGRRGRGARTTSCGRHFCERPGASVMGKRMFDTHKRERGPDEAPFQPRRSSS